MKARSLGKGSVKMVIIRANGDREVVGSFRYNFNKLIKEIRKSWMRFLSRLTKR